MTSPPGPKRLKQSTLTSFCTTESSDYRSVSHCDAEELGDDSLTAGTSDGK